MPLRDKASYLWDVAEAARAVRGFVVGKTFGDYLADRMLRRAVEREFTVIGEALVQARRHFPELEGSISNLRQITAFRNQLVHAYASIDSALVWGIIENDLATLILEAETLLNETPLDADARKGDNET